MEHSAHERLRWDSGRNRWRRRTSEDAEIVATNGAAMLVHVALRDDLHIGSRVDVELAAGRGVVLIRHIAPTGGAGDDSLVGVEFVKTDESLSTYLAARTPPADAGSDSDRWWWQEGR